MHRRLSPAKGDYRCGTLNAGHQYFFSPDSLSETMPCSPPASSHATHEQQWQQQSAASTTAIKGPFGQRY
jgi:hypothetical protein